MKKVRKQVNKSQQITRDAKLVIDFDQPVKKSSDFLAAFRLALGKNVVLEKYHRKNVYNYTKNGKTTYILSAAITYLSKPHPIFKKRIQLKTWYKDFYNEVKNLPNTDVRIIGVYHYEGNFIFCDFKIEDYIQKKMHSSSAHIYVHDFYQAIQRGIFHKIDMNKNNIMIIRSDKLQEYLDETISISQAYDEIIATLQQFNNVFTFNEWLKADKCIKEMLDAGWYQAKGTEWPGWYLEFKFAKFLESRNLNDKFLFEGNLKDGKSQDFDIRFIEENFYGDLKASDISKKQAPANDQRNTLEAINKDGRLWYIVFEHETKRDIDYNSIMAIRRMELIDEDYTYKEGDRISYQNRMKHSVKFLEMAVYELNPINMAEMLVEFAQGHNSGPQKNERAKKFLLKKDDMNNSVIYRYVA